MNTKNNTRSQKTGKRLKEAFLEIIGEGIKPEDVSVTAVCERAGIHRSSFYLHYTVPTEILEVIEKETMADMASYMKNISQESLTDSVESILIFIRDNDLAFRTILLSPEGEERIGRLLTEKVFGIYEADVDAKARPLLPYLHSYISGGSKDVVINWIKKGYRESPATIANLLTALSKSAISGLLD